MVSVLMSRNAIKHNYALTKSPITLEDVLNSTKIGKYTNKLECARRADGAAAVIVASTRFINENYNSLKTINKEFNTLNSNNNIYNTEMYEVKAPVIISGGEASGPLFPPNIIDEEMFSCEQAVKTAYENGQVNKNDIQFFGLYDCFPICFIRAIEAVGLAKRGEGGKYIEKMYELSEKQNKILTADQFPINTHGGLLAFGAPWEVPAMYNVIEAVQQLNNTVENKERQIKNCKRALVYGNGGIFSASAVAILGNGNY